MGLPGAGLVSEVGLSANLELSLFLTLRTPESMWGPESVHPCPIPVESSILRASPEPKWPPAMGEQGQSSLALSSL